MADHNATPPASFSSPAPRRRGLLWALAVLALALLAWLMWRHSAPAAPAKKAPLPVPVRTAQVVQQTVPLLRGGVGSVLPVMSVTVHTRVDGQLQSIAFQEGQDVKAGQVLARLDPRTFQAQLDQALAQQAKDQAALANARVDLARYEELIAQDATTRQPLDTQRALVSQLQAAVKTDQALIELARVNLGYTTITAPIAGRVGARLVDPGNIVRAADPGGLLVINQIDPIAVQFTLPESAFQAVNAALHASAAPLAVQALDRGTRELLASGQLVLLNNQIDASTGTIMLKCQLPNPRHKLCPGQSVDARVLLGQREQALTMPAPVVQRGPNGLFAYVIDAGDVARVQPIEVDDSASQGSVTVVTRGLAAGQRVVVDGQNKLTPGAHVVEMGAPSAPASAAQAGAGSQGGGGKSGGQEAAR
jgi:multidrug efflux system membrane fusion protein